MRTEGIPYPEVSIIDFELKCCIVGQELKITTTGRNMECTLRMTFLGSLQSIEEG